MNTLSLSTSLLSTNDAARRLGLSPRTLEALRVRGGGPEFIKLGRRVLYEPQSLTRWIDANRRHSTCDVTARLNTGQE